MSTYQEYMYVEVKQDKDLSLLMVITAEQNV